MPKSLSLQKWFFIQAFSHNLPGDQRWFLLRTALPLWGELEPFNQPDAQHHEKQLYTMYILHGPMLWAASSDLFNRERSTRVPIWNPCQSINAWNNRPLLQSKFQTCFVTANLAKALLANSLDGLPGIILELWDPSWESFIKGCREHNEIHIEAARLAWFMGVRLHKA